jgi:hypothetical protein
VEGAMTTINGPVDQQLSHPAEAWKAVSTGTVVAIIYYRQFHVCKFETALTIEMPGHSGPAECFSHVFIDYAM